MKTSSSDMQETNPSPMGWLQQLFAYFRDLTRTREEDSTFMLGVKALSRVFLLILMVLLSPVLLVGLAIAFIAVF